jgi:hypothetical protein
MVVLEIVGPLLSDGEVHKGTEKCAERVKAYDIIAESNSTSEREYLAFLN